MFGERGRGRAVEDRGGRQRQAGGRGEPVPQQHGRARVKAEFLERPARGQPVGVGPAEHTGGLGAHQGEQQPLLFGAGQTGDAGPQAGVRASGRCRFGAVVEGTPERVHCCLVEVGRQQHRLVRGQRGVQQGQLVRCGQCGAVRRPGVGSAGPAAPGECDRGQAVGPAVLGERGQQGVGPGSLAVGGTAQHGGGRGVQHERAQVVVAGAVVQREHAGDPGGRLGVGGVHHGAQRVFGGQGGQQLGHGVPVGGQCRVDGHHVPGAVPVGQVRGEPVLVADQQHGAVQRARGHRAGGDGHRGQARRARHPGAEHHLGHARAHRGDQVGGAALVHVHQGQPVRVRGERGAHHTPHRGVRQIRHVLAGTDGDGAPGEHHQAGRGEELVGGPGVEQVPRVGRPGVGLRGGGQRGQHHLGHGCAAGHGGAQRGKVGVGQCGQAEVVGAEHDPVRGVGQPRRPGGHRHPVHSEQ